MTLNKQKMTIFISLAVLMAILIVLRFLVFELIDINIIIDFLNRNFRDYGPLILILCGLLEGIAVAGLYFPGSTIILLGATLAGTGTILITSVIAWTTLGLFLAYITNYFLGRKGGEKFLAKLGFRGSDKIRKYIETSRLVYLWITIHPNLAAISAVIMGVLKINPARALAGLFIGQIIWSTIWGLLFYYFGMFLFDRIAFFIVLGMTVAIVWEIVNIAIIRKNSSSA